MNTKFLSLVTCLVSIIYVGCSSPAKNNKNLKNLTVRLTTYSRDEKLPKKHPDKWSRRGISATGTPLKNMLSVAVDPKIIPYFSKLKLSCLNWPVIATDTGSWVKSRRAALKNGINCAVVDLFFDRERDAANFRRKHPLFVQACILN